LDMAEQRESAWRRYEKHSRGVSNSKWEGKDQKKSRYGEKKNRHAGARPVGGESSEVAGNCGKTKRGGWLPGI